MPADLGVCSVVCPAGVDPARHDITGVKDITWHPNKTGLILAQGLGYHHWVSDNFGETWQAGPGIVS